MTGRPQLRLRSLMVSVFMARSIFDGSRPRSRLKRLPPGTLPICKTRRARSSVRYKGP